MRREKLSAIKFRAELRNWELSHMTIGLATVTDIEGQVYGDTAGIWEDGEWLTILGVTVSSPTPCEYVIGEGHGPGRTYYRALTINRKQ